MYIYSTRKQCAIVSINFHVLKSCACNQKRLHELLPNHTISFRVFWFCNIVAGLVLMFIFINPIYTKWSTNPTIVSPESTNYAIWNIYFPAVTICSNNKVLDGQLQRIVKKAPWVNMTANSTAIPNFNKLKGLKNAISNTILYEVEPHRLRSGNLNSTDEYLLNNHKSQIPKAMQQV